MISVIDTDIDIDVDIDIDIGIDKNINIDINRVSSLQSLELKVGFRLKVRTKPLPTCFKVSRC